MVIEQERKYAYVLKKFMEYCTQEHDEIISNEEAEQVLLAWISDHDLDLLFLSQDVRSLLPEADASTSQRYLIHNFILDAHSSDPDVFQCFLDYSIGHIFANAIIYQQDAFELEKDKLQNCNIYLDIAFFFGITGMNGEERKSAYIDFLETLRHQNARLIVFRHTYDEFRGIIEGSLQWIDSMHYDPLRASRASTYFVENGYSSSDVEEFILEIDPCLADHGIIVEDTPTTEVNTAHQINEDELTALIVDLYKNRDSTFDELDKEDTINRDVRSIGSVHRLRAGERPTSMRDASHVFVTANSALALANRRYEQNERKDKYFFIPNVVTDVFLGTVLWLESPKTVSTLSENRLIATCYSALQPTRTMIKKLVETADKLFAESEITADQVVLLTQTRVARNLLQEETLGDPNRFTDKTALDVLEELRSDIRDEERATYEQERSQLNAENVDLQKELSQRTSEAEDAQSQLLAYEGRIDVLAGRLAKIVTGIVIAIAILLVVYAGAMQFYPVLVPANPFWKSLLVLSAVLYHLLKQEP